MHARVALGQRRCSDGGAGRRVGDPNVARIAIGGFMHETNTFAVQPATYQDFERHDAWPGLSRGQALIQNLRDLNIPSGGFIAEAEHDDHVLVPLLWCSAEPSAQVTRDAYERIADMLCSDLALAGALDAVYLDLHGAMVSEHLDDGEGELIARVRSVVGDTLPIVVSLDLHANITDAMLQHASAITVYRTYPHIDMADTGRRAYALTRVLLEGQRLSAASRRGEFLIPLQAQCTDLCPADRLYQTVSDLSGRDVASADLALGFPPADIAECGAVVLTYDPDPRRAQRAADRIALELERAEAAFDDAMLKPPDAIARALAGNGPGPTVLADAQDNPGAGASADATGIITALVAARARRAVIGALHDPDAAAEATARGIGAEFEWSLGGKLGLADQPPYRARFRVVALGDGRFTCHGAMLAGVTTALGPSALLAVLAPGCDVRVVVTSQRFQCVDRALFHHLGVDLASERIVVVKSTVHFRADFDAIARETLVVEAPGSHPCRLETLNYRRLRPGIRLGPGGPLHDVREDLASSDAILDASASK